jgi:hypothetical protein
MTRISRRAALALCTSLALTVSACASTASTASSAPPSPGPTPSIEPSAETTSGAETSSAAPVSPAPADSPSATASAVGITCPVTPQTVLPPSDRLVDLAISSTPTDDLLTFVFATPTIPNPGGPPRGSLDAARPPFSYAGSGQQIALLGAHAVQVRFTGMSIASESGDATYTGPPDLRPNLPAVREAIQYDASEGVIGWYIGYEGSGCVTLTSIRNAVTITIGHPEAPAG